MKKFDMEIMGKEWEVRVCTEEEEPRLQNANGFMDWTARVIVIGEPPEDTNLEYPLTFMRKVLRHEIVHAMMFESGLMDNWDHCVGQDEAVVDWIAIQMEKLWKICGEAEGELLMLMTEEKNERDRTDPKES